MSRELTRQEKAEIRKLVTKWCANYDKDYGCLPLDCPCYMLGKCWTGAYCRYFRSAVLPLDPVLEKSLTVERITENRPCPVCGGHSPGQAAAVLFGGLCKESPPQRQQREYMRKKRRHAWKNSPGKCLHLQGFSGALSGWAVCFPARPCFRRNTFHIQALGLWDILSRSPV